METTKLGRIVRVLTFVSALIGTSSRIVLSAMDGRPVSVLGYFTVQSNLMVTVFLALALLVGSVHTQMHKRMKKSALLLERAHGAVLVYILVTAVVYNLLLAADMVDSGYSAFILVVNHSITPGLFLLDWLMSRRSYPQQPWDIAAWLIYPIGYALWASIEGAANGTFRYFFLDFVNVPFPRYLATIAAVVVGFIVLAILVHVSETVKRRAGRKT